MKTINTNNIGLATAIGAGVGTAFYSMTGEAVWIGIGAVVGALLSFFRKTLLPKHVKVKVRVKK